MNNEELQQKWPEIQDKLLKTYPTLTKEELMCEIGREGEVLAELQKKLGNNWKDIKNVLSIMG